MYSRYEDRIRMTKTVDKKRRALDTIKAHEEPAAKKNGVTEEQLQKLIRTKYTQCEKCGGMLQFYGRGQYICKRCGESVYDDFGKVSLFLDTHGPATKHEITLATGIDEIKVAEFLREKRLEVVNNYVYTN